MDPNKPNQKLHHKDPSESSSIEYSLSTRALHADDRLSHTTDVAPPLHVSTNFHYTNNADELVPVKDLDVSFDPTLPEL